MKSKVVAINWLDSSGPARGIWHSKEDALDFPPCDIVSVGFIIKETDTYITIAGSESEDCVQGILTIPKCSIIKTKGVKIFDKE